MRHERREEVMASLQLPAGSVVGDLGAGLGYFTFPLAQAVGPSGEVIAVDLNPYYLGVIAHRMSLPGYEHFNNIRLQRGTQRSTLLPEGSLDAAFISHLDFYAFRPMIGDMHVEWLDHVVRTVRPGGQLHVLQWFGVNPGASAENIAANFADAGVRHEETRCFAVHESCLLRFVRP